MYRLLFAGDDGQLYDHRTLLATGRTGGRFVELAGEDLVKLPAGASLVLVPGGTPVGMTRAGRFTALENNPWAGGRSWAVGALLPQGYTRTLLPSYTRSGKEKPLPLLGYTAVACRDGELYAAARLTDEPDRWDPSRYNTPDLPVRVREKLALFPHNPVLGQLAHCALEYRCFTAQNIFYGRWEGGVPVSPACNANCLGCISLQPAECCPPPQSRIGFSPAAAEVADVAALHLSSGEGAIISFGQGCEGEPALAAGTVVRAIGLARESTSLGTINMNSNGGYAAGVRDICRAGLDAIRVSLISAREDTYDAYYRPRGYSLADVRRSLGTAVSSGVYTSLNLLVYPGLTDREDEVKALVELIKETGVNLVQLRNLNIDPDLLFQHLPDGKGEAIGIPGLIKALKEVPGLDVGSFSRPVR
ncbi:MAG: molybdenum cofactor biosynthesis protein A [Pelotomaculum sp. PtaU1.Bin035]|nr:MAG: molybdenum cofactor biosynthesis protein A [Pelotomaculum sp. PtaU1.Bin035]